MRYLIKEEPIITDEGKQIEVFHLDIQDDPEIFEDWATQFRRNYCSDDELDEMIGHLSAMTTSDDNDTSNRLGCQRERTAGEIPMKNLTSSPN